MPEALPTVRRAFGRMTAVERGHLVRLEDVVTTAAKANVSDTGGAAAELAPERRPFDSSAEQRTGRPGRRRRVP